MSAVNQQQWLQFVGELNKSLVEHVSVRAQTVMQMVLRALGSDFGKMHVKVDAATVANLVNLHVTVEDAAPLLKVATLLKPDGLHAAHARCTADGRVVLTLTLPTGEEPPPPPPYVPPELVNEPGRSIQQMMLAPADLENARCIVRHCINMERGQARIQWRFAEVPCDGDVHTEYALAADGVDHMDLAFLRHVADLLPPDALSDVALFAAAGAVPPCVQFTLRYAPHAPHAPHAPLGPAAHAPLGPAQPGASGRQRESLGVRDDDRDIRSRSRVPALQARDAERARERSPPRGGLLSSIGSLFRSSGSK